MPSHANPVNWFEIPVCDMLRAKTFYEVVLSVDIVASEMGPNKMGWFPLVERSHVFLSRIEADCKRGRL